MDIRLNYCGPGLNYCLAKVSDSSKKTQLGLGCLFLPPTFYHPDTGEPYKIDPGIRREYEQIKKMFQKRLEKYYIKAEIMSKRGWISAVQTIWVGKIGLTLLEEGKCGIFAYRKWYEVGDIKKSKEELTENEQQE